MDTSSIYSSNYLKAASLIKPIVVTIAGLEMHPMQQSGDEKPVLLFKEDVPPAILNKTNFRYLQGELGTESDNWIGQKVRFSVVQVDYQGKRVPGLHVTVIKTEKSSPSGGRSAFAGAAASPPATSTNKQPALAGAAASPSSPPANERPPMDDEIPF